MKIVHISTSTIGGAGIAAKRLHLGLIQRIDISSNLIVQFKSSPEEDLQHIYTANPKVCLRYKIERRLKMTPEYRNLETLKKVQANYDIVTFPTTSYRLEELPLVQEADIVHLHWVSNFINYPTFFKNIKKPIVWTLHDINPFMGLFHFEADRVKNIETLGQLDRKLLKCKIDSIRKANDLHVVCLSNWMKNQSEKSLAFGQFPHILIPNGLNFDEYQPLDRTDMKKKIGVNNEFKTLLLVGAYLDSENKGFPLFFETIKKMNRCDFNLVTVGKNISDLSLNKNINHIHFDNIKSTEYLNEIYSAADITVIPSKEDNLPNVMLESFANGTPIMSFYNGGMAEHIMNEKYGILINEISEQALSENINRYLDSDQTFDSSEIIDYAKATFSDNLQLSKYIDLYKTILNL